MGLGVGWEGIAGSSAIRFLAELCFVSTEYNCDRLRLATYLLSLVQRRRSSDWARPCFINTSFIQGRHQSINLCVRYQLVVLITIIVSPALLYNVIPSLMKFIQLHHRPSKKHR